MRRVFGKTTIEFPIDSTFEEVASFLANNRRISREYESESNYRFILRWFPGQIVAACTRDPLKSAARNFLAFRLSYPVSRYPLSRCPCISRENANSGSPASTRLDSTRAIYRSDDAEGKWMYVCGKIEGDTLANISPANFSISSERRILGTQWRVANCWMSRRTNVSSFRR